jgi:hypothetical protein
LIGYPARLVYILDKGGLDLRQQGLGGERSQGRKSGYTSRHPNVILPSIHI